MRVKNSCKINLAQFGFNILQIETKSVCNMECRFCAYPIRQDKGRSLSQEAVYGLLDSIENNSEFKYVSFSQFNEPLLDNRIFDFIKYAKKNNLPVQIITNAALFNSKDIIANLADAAPDYIKVSVQTLNPKIFKSARGANMPYDEYINGIYEFLKISKKGAGSICIDVACNFLSGVRQFRTSVLGLERGDPSVYSSLNDLMPDFEKFLRDLSGFDPDFIFDKAKFTQFLNGLNANYSEDAALKLHGKIIAKVKPFYYGRRILDFYPIYRSSGCANRILSVLASGNAVPCCLAYDEILRLGNINEESLHLILQRNSDLLLDIKKGKNLPLYCRRCMGAPTRRAAVLKNIINSMGLAK